MPLALIILILSGCVDWVDETSDLKRFVADAQRAPGGQIAPLPEFKPYHSFVYKGASMRDPFKPLLPIVDDEQDNASLGASNSDIKPDEARDKEYLESFAIDQLVMVGTITKKEGDELWGLIKDGNSEIHRVHVGSYMGLDYGEIVEMSERQIELVEIVSNGRGGWMKRPRSLALEEQE
ncbi:pilus assembly protein PilP [uncultured Neptuniibacter sp.]|uniref:pilus assembly protein PilP n=1 Tax=uncultured Neptuniibacter sp. TaxID=502143 RepID=UPI0026188A69|nr:pilus assembly protein PilP [uncultured Neptuniibacter sp.]